MDAICLRAYYAMSNTETHCYQVVDGMIDGLGPCNRGSGSGISTESSTELSNLVHGSARPPPLYCKWHKVRQPTYASRPSWARTDFEICT
eukprot:3639577-Rhodomonas_salina.1